MSPPTNLHAKEILILYKYTNLSFTEIGNQLDVTRNTVAGIIWREKHPGMHTLKRTHSQDWIFRKRQGKK